MQLLRLHDDVIKWKHFPRYWPFVRGIHRSPVNSPHKGQWRGALMFTLICARINGWVNNREAGDLRRYRAHYDVTVMWLIWFTLYHVERGPHNCCFVRANGNDGFRSPLRWPTNVEFCLLLAWTNWSNSRVPVIWDDTTLQWRLCCVILIDPSSKSNNALDRYPTMHHFVTCAHLCYKVVHCGIWDCRNM